MGLSNGSFYNPILHITSNTIYSTCFETIIILMNCFFCQKTFTSTTNCSNCNCDDIRTYQDDFGVDCYFNLNGMNDSYWINISFINDEYPGGTILFLYHLKIGWDLLVNLPTMPTLSHAIDLIPLTIRLLQIKAFL